MTDILYLDEYGNTVDDGKEIHELIDGITDMLAAMTKAERLNWFRKSQYPYSINFDMKIGNTVVKFLLYRIKALNFSGRYGMIRIPTNHIISGCGKENYEHKTVR